MIEAKTIPNDTNDDPSSVAWTRLEAFLSAFADFLKKYPVETEDNKEERDSQLEALKQNHSKTSPEYINAWINKWIQIFVESTDQASVKKFNEYLIERYPGKDECHHVEVFLKKFAEFLKQYPVETMENRHDRNEALAALAPNLPKAFIDEYRNYTTRGIHLDTANSIYRDIKRNQLKTRCFGSLLLVSEAALCSTSYFGKKALNKACEDESTFIKNLTSSFTHDAVPITLCILIVITAVLGAYLTVAAKEKAAPSFKGH